MSNTAKAARAGQALSQQPADLPETLKRQPRLGEVEGERAPQVPR